MKGDARGLWPWLAGIGVAALVVWLAVSTVGQVAIEERLDQYRERVARLEGTPPGEGRAAPTRELLRSVAEVLRVIRDERYPRTLGDNGVMEDLHAALDAIDPDRSLDGQRHPLRRFLQGSGALLSAMARPGDPGPSS